MRRSGSTPAAGSAGSTHTRASDTTRRPSSCAASASAYTHQYCQPGCWAPKAISTSAGPTLNQASATASAAAPERGASAQRLRGGGEHRGGRDEQRHERRRQQQQHRHEDDLRRHGVPGVAPHLDRADDRVGGDEQQREPRRERPLGVGEQRRSPPRRPISRREQPVAEPLAAVELAVPAVERLLQQALARGVHVGGRIGHACRCADLRRMSYLLGFPVHRLEEHNESSRTKGLTQMYRKIGRTVAAAIIATIASAAFASTANAGLLTASAESCDDGPITQPFQRFGDQANYKLLPGGSFEAGTAPGSSAAARRSSRATRPTRSAARPTAAPCSCRAAAPRSRRSPASGSRSRPCACSPSATARSWGSSPRSTSRSR